MLLPSIRSSLKAALLASTIATAGVVSTAPVHAAPFEGYADLVEQVSPAVVFIEVTAKSKEPAGPAMSPQMEEFLRRFGQIDPRFRMPEAPQNEGVTRGLGSGFLISADGTIVTNNHVVADATSMKVKLQDGREFTAELVGTDPMTDIAVIRLKDAEGLPFVELDAADDLRVGDAVVAVGNPFGLGGTVTSGIVSAVGRNINSGPYDDYIQTDAAINRGNSGGPLFDTEGKVVGMNTAIYSPSGGSVGIGFSIPASTIQTVVAQLQETGSVSRGWLGVQIQPMTTDLAQALGLESTDGALVAAVQPDSPASASELQSGDVITAVNGTAVTEKRSLPTLIAAIPAGETAKLAVLRNGEDRTVEVKIGELSPEKLEMAAVEDGADSSSAPLGVTVEPLAPELARQLGLDPEAKGVVISEVAADSPNADRLTPGDVIEAVAGKPVATPEALAKALREAEGDMVLLKLNRRGAALFVGAEIASS
ncbi:serine protease [Cereibacter changlensis JA139]|uniref:Probable periplasmic serine endoprotease DegP-like n=2 Tax=Cereibacter changlensis TaxID=402884 RepID=A0A2T4JUK9_9RHOB|nr:Do family serine endopeptidase [Cereibacter changlensis]PTE21556.1 serine protease [Cereibacter changlensis JA139]PZX57474.1 serine protease Do [Cereibacter changlensis]